MNKKELKDKAKNLLALVRIGKSGISDNVVVEVNKQLKLHKLVKVKLLKSCLAEGNRKSIAKELALATSSELILVQGGVVTLYKEKNIKVNKDR
ncbi:YhbY family RNA-binding protein [Candidatus Woesearchaeota archaeon]|jgi:RNA-binding protein|nr:YhbY family RNA-binding protein [Candidatus Woesearchaeota archaeon]